MINEKIAQKIFKEKKKLETHKPIQQVEKQTQREGHKAAGDEY
jgi:hypothetical protein